MALRKGKTIVLLCGLAGLAVVLAFAAAFKDRVLEHWWIHQLGSSQEEVRLAAAERLGVIEDRESFVFENREPLDGETFGRILPEIPRIISALKHPDVSIRSWAVRLLAQIGPPARAAVPVLTELLDLFFLIDEAIGGEGSGGD